jgi:hypothetical protein
MLAIQSQAGGQWNGSFETMSFFPRPFGGTTAFSVNLLIALKLQDIFQRCQLKD